MRFRQNNILFWEGNFTLIVCIAASIFLMVYDVVFISALLIPSIALFITFIFHCFSPKRMITINETGIMCHMRKKLCWNYRWTDIAELKISSRYRNPSIEIILVPDMLNGNENTGESEAYFQLGLSARKAIKRFKAG